MNWCCQKDTIEKPWTTMNLWEKISDYKMDCMLKIDNNAIENIMHLVSLDWKNYLFSASKETVP